MRAIDFYKDGPVAVVVLNRPRVHNAFNTVMRDELYQALEAAETDPETLAVLLAGKGKNFCAGADLTEFGSAPSLAAAREARWARDLWGLFLSVSKPTVAAIGGHCIGSGLEMALLCDLRIASTDARFAMPEARLGLMPAAGGTQTLPRLLGPSRALELLYTGRRFSAQEALSLGLVTNVAPPDRLHDEAMALARRLSQLPIPVVRAVKEAVNRGADATLAQGLEIETHLALRLASAGRG